ncbi:structural protein Mdm1p [Trichomonascus vanleenenianus]|uniref:Mdm1p n=1 Tax=Trichomonascus vanleenenianus TaxID=2268995 RepID=UPI003ECB2102
MLVQLIGQRSSKETLFFAVLSAGVLGYVVKLVVTRVLSHLLGVLLGFLLALGLLIGISLSYVDDREDFEGVRMRRPLEGTGYLAFVREDSWKQELLSLSHDKPLPITIFPESFVISDSLDVLIGYVVRDFVLTWFRKVSSDSTFPAHVEHDIRYGVQQLAERAERIQWADFIVGRLLPIVTMHFGQFVEADAIVKEKSGRGQLTQSKELDYEIYKEYLKIQDGENRPVRHHRRNRSDGRAFIEPGEYEANNAIEHETYRRTWLADRANELISELLPASEQRSQIVVCLVKDIMANAVMFPITAMISDPDFWNQIITKTAADTLREQRKIKKLRKALEEHSLNMSPSMQQLNRATSSQWKGGRLNRPLNKLSPQADIHEFDRFVRHIKRTESLTEARQMRYNISLQLKRTLKTGDNPIYAQRLQKAKEEVDKRISNLSGEVLPLSHKFGRDVREDYALSEILNDPACSLFFMEFMDRRQRTGLLQFWLTVNGLRSPLEFNDADDDEDADPLGALKATRAGDQSSTPQNGNDMINMASVQDILQVYRYYISGEHPIVRVDDVQQMEALEEFARSYANSTVQQSQYKRAKRALFGIQDTVFHKIEMRDLAKFKQSDYFLKFLASAPSAHTPAAFDVDELQLDAVDNEEEFEEEPLEEETKNVYEKDAGENSIQQAVEEAFNDIMKNAKDDTAKSRLFEDEKGLYDEEEEESTRGLGEEDEMNLESMGLHLAAPGDLGLTEAIATLSQDINRLHNQQRVLEPLLTKAELTNNASDLRILNKSFASLEREIQRKELQRQQYIVQESENSLYGRSSISIQSHFTSVDESGQYVMYIIEVQRLGSDGSVSAGWIVARRYSQFYQLHHHLRLRYPEVSRLDFPKKRMVLKFQFKAFILQRQTALEKYLRQLLELPRVCRDKAFRLFLSSETFGVDVAASGSSPAFGFPGDTEQLLTASEYPRPNSAVLDSPGSSLANSAASLGGYDSEPAVKSFVQPICDLFIRVFGLDRHNWLRGRAVMVVVQQLLGGTIEKKCRELVAEQMSAQRLTEMIQFLTETLWPDGVRKPPATARSLSQKEQCRQEAKLILHQLISDLSSRVVGPKSARYASANLFNMYQNELLNTTLVVKLLEVVIQEVLSTD